VTRVIDDVPRTPAGSQGTRDPLQAPPPAFDLGDAARIADEVFGLSGSLTPLASERDLNFRVDAGRGSFLLKLHNPADDEALIDFQTQALLRVARVAADLPVMRVVPTRDGSFWRTLTGPDGRASVVRLFTFLDGHNAATEELGEGALFEWGATAARLGVALRGLFHAAAGYEIQWDVRRAPGLRRRLGHVRDDERRDLVATVLDRFEANVVPVIDGLRAQVIHNDLSLDNVLVDDRGRITGITDFGDMTHTALVCDLAVTLSDVLDGRADALEMAEPMIAGYESVTPLEPAEAGILADLVAARSATAIVIAAWRLDLYPGNEYVSTFDDGAWRLLRIMQAEGFDRVVRRFRDVSGRRGLPYRPAASSELLRRRRSVMGPATLTYERPLHIVRAEGVWMFDADGVRYLDCYNNVPVVGHGHPRVRAAVAAQTRLLNTNTRYLHEAVVDLSERLLATMPPSFDRVLFVNSGSEAGDVAWRIARHATGGGGAIVTRFAYHGVTEATTDLSPEEWPGGYAPERVELVPAPDGYRGRYRRDDEGWQERYAEHVADATRSLASRGMPLAAMVLDSAFTSDGVLGPVPAYVRAAAAAVRRSAALFVADEVQAGHGRSGEHLWSFAGAGVDPDLVTLGKPMGNGYPVSAVLATSDLADPFIAETGFFTTFGGNPVASAAALAVLQVIDDEGLVENARSVGAYVRGLLGDLARRHEAVGDVRGAGLMIGVEVVRDRDRRAPAGPEARRIVDGLRERGILIGSTGPDDNVLKIRPPLVFGREHADLLVGTLDEVLTAVSRNPSASER